MGRHRVRLMGHSLVRLVRLSLMRLTLDYLLVSVCGKRNQEKHGAGSGESSDQGLLSFLRKQFG